MNPVQPLKSPASLEARMPVGMPAKPGAFQQDLKQAATDLISSALVLPALSSLHESPLRPQTGAFAPSSAEKRFAPLLEMQFADRVAKAANFGIVDSIVNRFQPGAAAAHVSMKVNV